MILGIKNKTIKNIYYAGYCGSCPPKPPKKQAAETAAPRTGTFGEIKSGGPGLRITLDYDRLSISAKEYKVRMPNNMEEVKYVGNYEIIGGNRKDNNSKKHEYSYGTGESSPPGYIINIKI